MAATYRRPHRRGRRGANRLRRGRGTGPTRRLLEGGSALPQQIADEENVGGGEAGVARDALRRSGSTQEVGGPRLGEQRRPLPLRGQAPGGGREQGRVDGARRLRPPARDQARPGRRPPGPRLLPRGAAPAGPRRGDGLLHRGRGAGLRRRRLALLPPRPLRPRAGARRPPRPARGAAGAGAGRGPQAGRRAGAVQAGREAR